MEGGRESAFPEAGGDGLGQLIGPVVGAEQEGRVAETDRGFILLQIDAGKAPFRQLLAAGKGDAIKSRAEFHEVDHL